MILLPQPVVLIFHLDVPALLDKEVQLQEEGIASMM